MLLWLCRLTVAVHDWCGYRQQSLWETTGILIPSAEDIFIVPSAALMYSILGVYTICKYTSFCGTLKES